MSRYDYRDPAHDPLYCEGLQPDDMPDSDLFDTRNPEWYPDTEMCAWCGEPLRALDWHPYCSSQCGLYAEIDSVEED